MLQELAIKNFAIIDDLDVSFGEGMTVLTGETGAGKSIIIDAVGLLVGGRGSTDYIREGASKCLLEGQFSVLPHPRLLEILADLAIEIEDNTLILSREISRNGKNVCRINRRLVNTTNLREVGSFLVDIHGQNEHQELMNPDSHLSLLDQFGVPEIDTLKTSYSEAYTVYQELLKKIQAKKRNEKEFAQRIDMLQFQSEEIEAGEIKVGEEALLLEERNRLINFQKIVDSLKNTHEALVGGEYASLDQVGLAMNEMLEIEEIDEAYSEISEVIKNSYYQLQEVTTQVTRQLDVLELDEGRLDEVELRLTTIRQLKRKYGDSEESILAYLGEISQELAESVDLDSRSEVLSERLVAKEKKVRELAEELTQRRKEISRKLEQAIVKQLKELYLDKTQFEVRFLNEDKRVLRPTGQDEVEFYITTNPGEPLKPLVKVVSGGELSRVMLALKTIFSRSQGVTSIVFDEVDTGVSGRVAQAIAQKIYQIASRSQVLCISHLPQVAAVANTQYFIEKKVKDNRTTTSLTQLTYKQRVLEVARMLAGEEITQLTKDHAEELLQQGQKKEA